MKAIEVYSGHYIAWCDKCWYETTTAPRYYDDAKAEEIVKMLVNHYVYKCWLVDMNGNKEERNALKKKPKEFVSVSVVEDNDFEL